MIAATDSSATSWLAFSPPVEMGAGSYWARQAAKNGLLLVWISLGATALCALAARRYSRGARSLY